MQHFDFIFAGGGVAGLSLAHSLISGPFAGARVLLLDHSFTARSNHALSFWTEQPTPYEPLVARTWQRLKVAGPGFEKETPLQRMRYQTMRALDFSDYLLQKLDAAPGVTRLQSNVSRVQDGDDGATVWAGGRPYRGDWVFDSRFDSQEAYAASTHTSLWQYFVGWEIETPHACFDPFTATLMDLRLPQQQGLQTDREAPPKGAWRFFYVLPYTARRALVEYVALQPDHDNRALPGYLRSVLGIEHYDILSREAGAIPMTDRRFPRQLGRHVMAIGARGGRIKPSTGYGFTRILQDNVAITRSLQQRGHPFDVRGERPFYHFCDSLMLRMLAQRGAWALPLFSTLLQHNPLERVLRFLDETASPLQCALLSATLLPQALTLARHSQNQPAAPIGARGRV